jgi:hypothetical protein
MNQCDGEFAALRHQREMDALGTSPCVDTVMDAMAGLVEKVGIPGSGLFRKTLKSGRKSL